MKNPDSFSKNRSDLTSSANRDCKIPWKCCTKITAGHQQCAVIDKIAAASLRFRITCEEDLNKVLYDQQPPPRQAFNDCKLL